MPLSLSDIEIIRGNNFPPAKWQFLASEDPVEFYPLDGSVFKLEVTWPGAPAIIKTTDADSELVIGLADSTVTWNYSTEQSRSLPLGRIARYELERWAGGTQQSLIAGYFVVDAGANPD